MIIRDCCKQLYINRLENLGKTDKFLEIHKTPKLNQEEIGNKNRPNTSN